MADIVLQCPVSPNKQECSSTTFAPARYDFAAEENENAGDEHGPKENRHSFPPAEAKTELLHLLSTPSFDSSSRSLVPQTPKRTSCVQGLFGLLPSRNEQENDKDDKALDIHLPATSGCHAGRLSPRETKYYLDASVTRKAGNKNCEDVIHRFRWVPKNACLRMVPFQAVTVGSYSYQHHLDRDIYAGKNGLQFEEFEPLYELARKFHKETEGVAWAEAVLLTKEAVERADAIVHAASDGQRASAMDLHQDMMQTPITA